MEGRQANFTNNGKTITEEAMLLSNQMTGQMVNHTSAKQLVFVKQKKFGKKTFIGFTIALFLVVATSLGVYLFSSKETNLDGLWVNGNNAGLVYDLNGKKSKHIAGYTEEEIKEISTGKKDRQKFEANLEKLSDSKLKLLLILTRNINYKQKRSYW